MTDVTGPTNTRSDDRKRRYPRQQIGLDRLNAFSDGVYAIAITLLVLELSVPEGTPRIFAALGEQWQESSGTSSASASSAAAG